MQSEVSKVLILGSAGMLGREVANVASCRGYAVTQLSRKMGWDARAEDSLADLRGFHLVINCVAITKPDLSAEGLKDLFEVNSLFPKRLAAEAERQSFNVCHISTDGVFPRRAQPFHELDSAAPGDHYGLSKLLGEIVSPQVLNLRCSLIGIEAEKPLHFMSKLLSNPDGSEVSAYANHLWQGVTTRQLAEFTLGCAASHVFEELRQQSPVLHFVPNHAVSKLELSRFIVEGAQRDIKIIPARDSSEQVRVLATLYGSSLVPCAAPFHPGRDKQNFREIKLCEL